MEIPYGKVAIYLLTFLGYIYSGYGSSVLTNLRDAIFSAETVFGSVFENVITAANKFRIFHEVFDAAVEEECIFKCPTNAEPKPRRNYKQTANGCGSLGLQINTDYLPVGEMTKCCDAHDMCYDSCNHVKEVCDVDFKRCLYRYCDTYDKSIGGVSLVKTCKGAAKVLFTGTLTLGCKSYLLAQENACYCPPGPGWKDKKNYKYTSGADRKEL